MLGDVSLYAFYKMPSNFFIMPCSPAQDHMYECSEQLELLPMRWLGCLSQLSAAHIGFAPSARMHRLREFSCILVFFFSALGYRFSTLCHLFWHGHSL